MPNQEKRRILVRPCAGTDDATLAQPLYRRSFGIMPVPAHLSELPACLGSEVSLVADGIASLNRDLQTLSRASLEAFKGGLRLTNAELL